jgi:hypothetical protein
MLGKTINGALTMSKEFEKIKALLDLCQPSDRDPQVDRAEAAKLAARWGWLIHRARGMPRRVSSDAAASTGSFFG